MFDATGDRGGEAPPVNSPAAFRAPEASALEGHPTGPGLAITLAEADPAEVDDFALVELVAAWTRLTSWAQAGAARAAAELAARASQVVSEEQPAPEPDGPARRGRRGRVRSVAAHELAMRLCITRDAAQAMIENGRAMRGALTPVGEALASGEIDLPRARAFVAGLALAPMEVALAVQEEVLPRAPRRTARQVAGDIARALITTDPVEAERRHQRARSERKVCRPALLPDGMAGLWCVLPAADAVALDIALDAGARSMRAAGDERSMDQLRADALATVGHSALATGWFGVPPPGGVVLPSTAEDGVPSLGSWEARSAPLAGESVLMDPSSIRLGQIGGRVPQIRVTVPLAILLPDDVGGGDGSPHPTSGGPPPPTSDGPPTPASSRPPRTQGAGAERRPTPTDDAAAVFDPLEHAVDRDCVAELEGYGPITPAVARALALGGTWRRLIVDPLSGIVRDVGRERYRPPADLAELVRARDRTCTRPGCGASARGCDLDHTVPYHLGGRTAEQNLGALCPADHAMKSAGGFRVRQVTPGVFEYDLPSGHSYRREADGTSTLVRRASREAAGGEPLGDGLDCAGQWGACGERGTTGERGATGESQSSGDGSEPRGPPPF